MSSTGSNCVIYNIKHLYNTPADAKLKGFFEPPGGQTALSSHGVPWSNYGVCTFDSKNPEELAALTAAGFSLHDPKLPGTANNAGGAAESVKGNELPNTPPLSVIAGAQYNWRLDSGYAVVPRLDVYWQSSSWARIFDDNPDKLKQWVEVNAMVTLNAPDDKWYAALFVKNLAGSNAVTGQYLASSVVGLYTNDFLIDPRTYGIRIGAKF